MRFLIILFSIFLAGCGSTPYQDDYIKHINVGKNQFLDESDFNYSFVDYTQIDFRGKYSSDDSISESATIYQSDLGLVGFLAQVATHSSLIESQRQEKLNRLQTTASEQISPLVTLIKTGRLIELVDEPQLSWINSQQINANTVMIKPIFFSNEDMTELSVKTLFWIPNLDKKGKNKYQNMVQAYARKLTDIQRDNILAGDAKALKKMMSRLLNRTLLVIKNEVTGQYQHVEVLPQTFVFKEGIQSKVVRGSIIEQQCDYHVIQDIHSWFHAYPKENLNSSVSIDTRC